MNRILEALISLFKMFLVTLIIVAGFIGFGRIVNWCKNGFTGVHEEKSTELGLKILGWWLFMFTAILVTTMFLSEYSSTYHFIVKIASYWVLSGFIVWLLGLFGYALSDLPAESIVQ